jgi:hypothetical protein
VPSFARIFILLLSIAGALRPAAVLEFTRMCVAKLSAESHHEILSAVSRAHSKGKSPLSGMRSVTHGDILDTK